jgi:signal transduction histidine kinase/DNA-binding NarL/FixJ family response regulator
LRVQDPLAGHGRRRVTVDVADDKLHRLERRLDRERAARFEAEAIAERGTRELYQQAEHLRLLETVSAAANTGGSVDETFRLTLQRVCEFMSWEIGHVFVRAEGEAEVTLVSHHLWWIAAGCDANAFVSRTEALSFGPGDGLPGRVWVSCEPAWVGDIAADVSFPRADAAGACGLASAFAFPVLIGSEIVAILEFYSSKPSEPEATILRTMAHVGVQLGRVIERSRNDARLEADKARLQQLIAEADIQREAAEAANRAKSAFLATTSHEVRTPLNAVLGLTEALKLTELNQAQAGLVAGVLESGAVLSRLLDSILDLASAESGSGALRTCAFDLRATVDRVVKLWAPNAAAAGSELRIAPDWPAQTTIVGDEGKVEQTLINMVSNALKFGPPGEPVTIAVDIKPVMFGEALVHISVIDRGEGVEAEERQAIFRPFEQTASGRQRGGAGVGLAVCAANVRLLDGEIGCDRTDRGESRFWFTFPARLAEADVGTAPATPPAGALRILAAEDNAANRQVLSALLEPLDVSVTFATDGRAALDCLARENFDVVLMDAQMPVMDGVSAVRAIRGSEPNGARLPIYMVTANVFAEDLDRYRQVGADGVIKKPIDVMTLYAALQDVAVGVHRSDCRSAASASTASAVVAQEQVKRTEPSRNL